MRYIYQSLANFDHKVYLYKGEFPDEDAPEAAEYFRQSGCETEIGDEDFEENVVPCPHAGHKVLILDGYRGDRVYEDGSLFHAA